jgi:hypothetical protein
MSVEKSVLYQQSIDTVFFFFASKDLSNGGLSTYPPYYCYYDFKGIYMI